MKPKQEVYKVRLLDQSSAQDIATILKVAELALRVQMTGGDMPKRVKRALGYIKEAYRQSKEVVLEEIPYERPKPSKEEKHP